MSKTSPQSGDSVPFLRPSERFARTGIFGENGLYGQGGSLNPRSNSTLSSQATAPSSPETTFLSSPATSPSASRKGSLLPSADIQQYCAAHGDGNRAYLEGNLSNYPVPAGASSRSNNAQNSNLPSLSFKDSPKPSRAPVSPEYSALSPQTPSKKKTFFSSFGRSSRKELSSSAVSDDEGPSRPSRFFRSFSSTSGKRSKSLGRTGSSQATTAVGARPEVNLADEWVVLQESDSSKFSTPAKTAENGKKAMNYSKPRQYSESAVQRPSIVQTPPPVSKRHPKETPTHLQVDTPAVTPTSPPFYLKPERRGSSSRSSGRTISPVPSQQLIGTGGPISPSAAQGPKVSAPRQSSPAGAHQSRNPTNATRLSSPIGDPFTSSPSKQLSNPQPAHSPTNMASNPLKAPSAKQARTSVGHPSALNTGFKQDDPASSSVDTRAIPSNKTHRQSMPAPSRPAGQEAFNSRPHPVPSVPGSMMHSLQPLDQLRGPPRRPAAPELPGPARTAVPATVVPRTRRSSAPTRGDAVLLASESRDAVASNSTHSKESETSKHSFKSTTTCQGKPRFEEALLQHIGIFSNLLDYLSYESMHALRQTSSALRTSLVDPDRKELILERYLGGIGYRRLAPTKSRPNAVVDINLRDLHAFLASTGFSLSEYAIFSSEHKRQALNLQTQRMIRASTRAYNKLVIRLRQQSTQPTIALSKPYWAKMGLQASIYKSGRTVVLRVWTPCAGTWMTDNELVDCEREVHRSGVWKYLMKGDLVRNVAQSDIANEGVVIFDGKFLRDLSYAHDPVGHTPSWINALAFSPSHYHNQLASSGSTPVIHLDLTPFVQSIQANMKLCQEKADVTSPSGDRYRVNRYVYRTAVELKAGIILGDAGGQGGTGPGGIESLHPDWEGQLFIEIDGTSEAAKELINRATAVQRTPQPNQPRIPVDVNNHPYRVIRNLSRPGQIWVKPVVVEQQKKR